LVGCVEQAHGQAQAAFAVCGVDASVGALLVALFSGAVGAAEHDQSRSRRAAGGLMSSY
jgi:hypothetical protein